MKIRRLAIYLTATIAGIGVGGISALAMASLLPGAEGISGGNVDVDGWRGDFSIGSSAADPYTRARVARHGLMALARSEAVYFIKAVDSAGRPLVEDCDYRVSGGAMPARWWSITLYDADNRLPMNDDAALSIDQTRAGEGNWSAIVSAQQPEEALWVSSRNAGTFDLTLRLYVPETALIDAPNETLDPPIIERLACRRDAA